MVFHGQSPYLNPLCSAYQSQPCACIEFPIYGMINVVMDATLLENLCFPKTRNFRLCHANHTQENKVYTKWQNFRVNLKCNFLNWLLNPKQVHSCVKRFLGFNPAGLLLI